MEDIHLTNPVTVGERTVTDLHFNDPQLMHMMRTDGHNINDIGADVELVSALTGEPVEIVKRIHIEDWAPIRVQLQKIYAVFFGLKKTLADDDSENPMIAAKDSAPQK